VANLTTNSLSPIKSLLSNDSVKRRFEEMLGKRAGAFSNSIINVVRQNQQLQQADPNSIISAAMIAATLNLPIDPALGQAAIVPYHNSRTGKTVAQFQIMYKGVVQLCIRSGQYETIHCTEVYADELESYNPITGEIKFTDPSKWKMRYEKDEENIVGHYARFKLLSGFEKCDYMTKEEVFAHAKKYSKSYQYDLRDGKKTSKWSTDWVPMGNKTVLLRLLTKYGIMSIEMQDAIKADYQTDFRDAQNAIDDTIEMQTGSVVIDADFEQSQLQSQQENEVSDIPDESFLA